MPSPGRRKQAWRGIVLVHDQVGIGFVTLERNADDHLTDGGAGQGVGAAQGLRAEQHVNAKRAALPDDAIQQDGRALGNAVFLHKKFLKFVNDQQRPRHGFGPAGPFVSGEVLGAELAEQIAAAAQFRVHAFEHAQAEGAVALNGNDFCVRQPAGGVALELHALFKVHQIKFHLFGTAPQRQVGDNDVKEGGFARTGLASNQAVLARGPADCEILKLGGAGTANRHAQFVGRVFLPEISIRRRHLCKRHFDPRGILAALAHLMEKMRGSFRRRRRIEPQPGSRGMPGGQPETVFGWRQANAVFAEFVGDKFLRRGLPLVPLDQRVNATTRTAGGDIPEPPRGGFAEIDRKRSDDEKMIFFGDGVKERK